jgi:hypothetical protein
MNLIVIKKMVETNFSQRLEPLESLQDFAEAEQLFPFAFPFQFLFVRLDQCLSRW